MLLGVVGLATWTGEDSRNSWNAVRERVKAPYTKSVTYLARFLSTAEHEKFRRNPGGPSPKAKYFLVTDSEPVP